MSTALTSLDAISVTTLKGVGGAMAVKLGAIGIVTLQDVLFHLPFRYQDRTRLSRIAQLHPGREGVIVGEVIVAEVVMRRRRSLLVRLHDGTGSITLRFFHFSQAQVKQFARGARVQCFGEARRGPAMLEMVHPEYRVISPDSAVESALDRTLTPFYPTTEGVQQTTLRKLTDQALAGLDANALHDWLPATLPVDGIALPDLATALRIVHRPPPGVDVAALMEGTHPAHRRLALEELVAHRLGLRLLRVQAQRFQVRSIRSKFPQIARPQSPCAMIVLLRCQKLKRNCIHISSDT